MQRRAEEGHPVEGHRARAGPGARPLGPRRRAGQARWRADRRGLAHRQSGQPGR